MIEDTYQIHNSLTASKHAYDSNNLTEQGLKMLNRMIDKLKANKGIAIGFHGTSRKRAEQIMEKGFENRTDRLIIHETPGVFAWDEDFKNSAILFGKRAAELDKDTQYALIKIEMQHPEPDFKMGRPQWKAQADQVSILDVEYYSIEQVISTDTNPNIPTLLSQK